MELHQWGVGVGARLGVCGLLFLMASIVSGLLSTPHHPQSTHQRHSVLPYGAATTSLHHLCMCGRRLQALWCHERHCSQHASQHDQFHALWGLPQRGLERHHHELGPLPTGLEDVWPSELCISTSPQTGTLMMTARVMAWCCVLLLIRIHVHKGTHACMHANTHTACACLVCLQMHFLISSMSPLGAPKDVAKLSAPRTLDQVSS